MGWISKNISRLYKDLIYVINNLSEVFDWIKHTDLEILGKYFVNTQTRSLVGVRHKLNGCIAIYLCVVYMAMGVIAIGNILYLEDVVLSILIAGVATLITCLFSHLLYKYPKLNGIAHKVILGLYSLLVFSISVPMIEEAMWYINYYSLDIFMLVMLIYTVISLVNHIMVFGLLLSLKRAK